MSPCPAAAGADRGLPRRDIMAIYAYLNRCPAGPKSVDGAAARAEIHLERLAAAARMQ